MHKNVSAFGALLRRLFFGDRQKQDTRYTSPSRLAAQRFFRKPLALCSTIVLSAMFLFVFIGPIFDPIDLSYIEPMHKNIAPCRTMMKLPQAMKTDPVAISSRGSFTLGLDRHGNIHLWGYYSSFSPDPAKNVMNIPDAVKAANILYAAAGSDHCIAIGDDGTVYAWGENDNGQFGKDGRLADMCPYLQPDELIFGKTDPGSILQLSCGNQMTALLLKDGTLYVWGNTMSSGQNTESVLKQLQEGEHTAAKVVFTNSDLFVLTRDGILLTGKNQQYALYRGQQTAAVIGNRKIKDIAASGDQLALVLEDDTVLTLGYEGAEPALGGESVRSLSAGMRHFSLLTGSGKIISWGNDKLGQTDVPHKLTQIGSADLLFSSGFQNYAFRDGSFVDAWGLKGYIFGTDDMGRDILSRVVNGGRMTMTIGAAAVIVSTVIGVLVGCVSGYFGGMVDILLMRITEIFSAIPFLPFALVLSAVLQSSNLSENIRIFIIMVILGLLSWTGLARLVRGQVLAEREKEFVIAAKSMGIRSQRIAFRHILPNVVSVILVSVTLDFAACMLTESTLSYLGFGVQLPRPTWGNMLEGCRDSLVIQNYWWRWLFPALFLSVAVVCINTIGDSLRDVLDPKSEVGK